MLRETTAGVTALGQVVVVLALTFVPSVKRADTLALDAPALRVTVPHANQTPAEPRANDGPVTQEPVAPIATLALRETAFCNDMKPPLARGSTPVTGLEAKSITRSLQVSALPEMPKYWSESPRGVRM